MCGRPLFFFSMIPEMRSSLDYIFILLLLSMCHEGIVWSNGLGDFCQLSGQGDPIQAWTSAVISQLYLKLYVHVTRQSHNRMSR